MSRNLSLKYLIINIYHISGLLQSDLDNSNRSPNGYRNSNLNDNQTYTRRDYSKSPERKLSVSSDISDKVNKFEALANSPETSRETSPKNLWFYKDGLRTPTTPPPISSKLVLSVVKAESTPPTILDNMSDSRPYHISTAQLTLSPRSARAKINADSEMAKSISSLAVTLSNGSNLTTSFTKNPLDSDIDIMSKSLSSLSFSSLSSSLPLKVSSLESPAYSVSDKNHMNNNDITSPKYPERPHNPPPIPPSRIKNGTPNRTTNLPLPVLAPNPSKPPPPPLPPKQTKEKTPPPRPISKELKLDDILSMCAEYERQIEAEQKEAYALSPLQQTPTIEFETDINTQSISRDKPDNVTIDTPLSPSLGPLSPSSPSSTLQPPRIKTNGSLPRDGKRLPSPSRSLPPNSPHIFSNSENEISGNSAINLYSCNYNLFVRYALCDLSL